MNVDEDPIACGFTAAEALREAKVEAQRLVTKRLLPAASLEVDCRSTLPTVTLAIVLIDCAVPDDVPAFAHLLWLDTDGAEPEPEALEGSHDLAVWWSAHADSHTGLPLARRMWSSAWHPALKLVTPLGRRGAGSVGVE